MILQEGCRWAREEKEMEKLKKNKESPGERELVSRGGGEKGDEEEGRGKQ